MQNRFTQNVEALLEIIEEDI